MQAHLYRVECLTNLHVGSGETTYSIVDNEVERDPILVNVPIIHSSGVKGALRQHCVAGGMITDAVRYIFGQESRSQEDDPKTSPGQYKFFTATLLARPLRVSKGNRSYLMTTTPELLNSIQKLAQGVGIKGFEKAQWPSQAVSGRVMTNAKLTSVEGSTCLPLQASITLQELIDQDYGLVESFRDFALPVIARNQLENGISQNLWYEEVVPYKSVFTFVVLRPENDQKLEFFNMFNHLLTGQGAVQFGGNASVGYGYTTVTKVV